MVSAQNNLIKQLCTLNKKLVSIIKNKSKATGKLVQINRVHREKESDLIMQISSLKALLDENTEKKKNCADIFTSTESVVYFD